MRATYKSVNQDTYLYTKGKEFVISVESRGKVMRFEEYIGEYHYSQNKPWTGPVHTRESKLLRPYDMDKSIIYYDYTAPKQQKIKEYIEPYDTKISPKEAHYDTGLFIRYFVKRANETRNIVYEINEETAKLYGKPGGIDPNLYVLTKMNWYITKDPSRRQSVLLENSKSLKKANMEMRGIIDHVINLYEFSFEVI